MRGEIQWPQRPTHSEPPHPLSLRPKAAARALGVSEKTLWNMTKRNAIPHARMGTCVVYPWAALQAWLQELTAHPPVKRPEDAEGGDA